jgi:UDP-glucose 4-epimerase
VIVTGVGGFLGEHLAGRLAAGGTDVVGLDRVDRPVRGVGRQLVVDLLDPAATSEAIAGVADEPGASVVVHLMGMAHAGACRDNPTGAIAANVVATTNVLEACRKVGVRRFVFPSSALVYRLPARTPVDEDAPTAARSIYAATKLACESLLQAYAADFGFSCVVARLGNVFGSGAAEDSVASIVLRQVLAGRGVVVETLEPVRDFIYRDDVVSGLVALASLSGSPGSRVVNLATGVPTSIREFAEAASRLAGVSQSPVGRTATVSGPMDRIVLSIERIGRLTGWRPAFTLESGIEATLAERGK